MHSFRLTLLGLVALAAMASSTLGAAAEVGASQDALHRAQHRRHFGARSVTLDGGRKMQPRRLGARGLSLRATAEQRAQQERLNQQAAQFASDNSAWQQAANQALSEGKTAEEFGSWVAAHGGGGSSQNQNQGEPEKPKQTNTTPKSLATENNSGSQSGQQGKQQDTNQNQDNQQTSSAQEPKETNQDNQPKQSSSASQPKPTGQDNHHNNNQQQQQQQQQQHEQATTSSQSQTQSQAQSQPSSSSSSSSSGVSASTVYQGKATYYSMGLGACGQQNSDSDFAVALKQSMFDEYTRNGNPNKNSLCNRKISITCGGNTQTATIVDSCPGCPTAESLDLSPALFQALVGDLGKGVADISWHFV